ncbi:hypothetical protein AUJ14_03855 [Candidatus Micrarchaeota archaeon CG1_02_55_22]|nr:MAG: hypothetical protein AUJ14_03855 [Candidatus Micrarchaeota archaeon CG1_02_55_22]
MIKATVLNKEKDFLEIQFNGMDEGLANLLVEKLSASKTDFAAYSLEHPLTGNPIVRIKASSPKEELVTALKAIEKEASEAIAGLSDKKK